MDIQGVSVNNFQIISNNFQMDFEQFPLQKSKCNSEMGKISLVNTKEILPISELHLLLYNKNSANLLRNCLLRYEIDQTNYSFPLR